MIGRRAWFGFVAISVASLLAGCGQSPADGEIAWLLVVQGEVTEVREGEIVLAVPTTAIAFSDRPDREVRLLDLADFVAAAWADDGGFRADPPNASLVDETDGEIAVVEILGMSISGSSLTVAFEIIEGIGPTAGDRIVFTIDAVSTVNPQITD